MANPYEVSVYSCDVCFNIIIPISHIRVFTEKFFREFKEFTVVTEDIPRETERKYTECCYAHPGGQHIRLKVRGYNEERFYDFLRKFCSASNLALRELA